MKNLSLTLLILINFLSFNKANASHVMGSDFSWKCVGKDSFLVKFEVYRDCNGISLTSYPINFYCATTNTLITSLNIGVGTPVDVTPICNSSCTRCSNPGCSFPYGINKYTMQGIVNLGASGSCCSIKITCPQSSRNAAITTSTGAGSADFYTEALLNRCQSPCDNSPTFSNSPMAILCVGRDVNYNPGMLDVDVKSTGGAADSFTFEWAEPLSAATSSIPYVGSYLYSRPIFFWGFPNDALPFPRGLHLDPQLGTIQFRPMKAEVTIMVIKVNEFRNGVKIAELRREMQIIVIACTSSNPPTITTAGNIRSKSVCAGDTVIFDFSTYDKDTIDTVKISWNKAIQGAIWTDSNGLKKHPSARLIWIPTDNYVSSLPYSFTVTAKDNACPSNASFTQSYQITVNPIPKANIIAYDSGCGQYWFSALRIQGSGPIYSWTGNSFSFNPQTGPLITHKFQPGIYPYSMTMTASGCSKTYYDTVKVDTFITNKLPADTTVCYRSTITLYSSVKYNQGKVNMTWGSGGTIIGSNTGLSKTITLTRDTVIWSSASDSMRCPATDTIHIFVYKQIIKINPIDSRCLIGAPISLNNFVTVNGKFKAGGVWSSPSAGLIYDDKFDPITAGVSSPPGWKVIYEYPDSATGCYNRDSSYVTVFALPKPFAGYDDSICKGKKISLVGNPSLPPGSWRGIGVEGNSPNWRFNSDSVRIVAGNSYKLIYHYKDNHQCENEDTVKITVNPNPSKPAVSLNPSDFYLECNLIKGSYEWFYRSDSLSAPTNIHKNLRRIDPKTYCSNCYFSAIYTDSNGCSSDTSKQFHFIVNSINSNHESQFIIYPNPAKNLLFIENAGNESVNLTLSDIYGKTLNQVKLLSGKNSLNISGLKPGIYILRLNDLFIYKLVIE